MNHQPKDLISDINVTPLVDVMLVLLIIFMITAPLMSTGLEVDLPETKAGELKKETPLMISITQEGKIFIGHQEIPLSRLDVWLKEAQKRKMLKDIAIKADKRCPYGVVAKVLSEIQALGITNIGLVTRLEKDVQ